MKKDYTVKMEKDEWGKLLTHVYEHKKNEVKVCLLYTSDAADE